MTNNSSFDQIMTASALDKDEAECIANFGSLQNLSGVSFSGIYPPSQINFMPKEDTLFNDFENLQSVNNGKENKNRVKNKSNVATTSATVEVDSLVNSKFPRTPLTGLPKIAELSAVIGSIKERNNTDTPYESTEFRLRSSFHRGEVQHNGNDEDFRIEFTHESLSWPTVQIGETMKKSCLIKFNSKHNWEKIYFSFGDLSGGNCFRFFHMGKIKKEFFATVARNTPFEIQVIFLPEQTTQYYGTVVINRLIHKNNIKCSTINLYAYGGKSLPSLVISFSLEEYTPQLIFNESGTANFSLQNLGSAVLFFMISIRSKFNEFWFSIVPKSGVVSPGKETTITIQLKLVGNYSNVLLNKPTLMKLAEMEMQYGDESTRLRIAQIYKSFRPFCKESVIAYLSELVGDIPTSNVLETKVNNLQDSYNDLACLYLHGIRKSNISIYYDTAIKIEQMKFNFKPLHEK